jgi:Right handed beta helix region
MPIDISRSSTDFRKHYTSVRAQMGRVLTDDDHNENERIHDEDERRSRVETIGAAASPDNGFRIQNPKITPAGIDFGIMPGVFFLGGNRLELETQETFQKQSDWLDITPMDIPPPPDASGRFDLIYLEAWDQDVTQVEDDGLKEPGLGGPDTSARLRQMRRVKVSTGVTGDCEADWAALLAQQTADGLGTLNLQNELVVDTTLTVGFGPGVKQDLCSPLSAPGYLGAENQAIRVQLLSKSTFTYGFDNASYLYTVKVGTDGQGQPRMVTMVTQPRDTFHYPATGLLVEFLVASAALPDGQSVAAMSGRLARVASPYDPKTAQFMLASDIPAGDFFLRVWDRGADVASADAIPFQPGVAVTLGDTGLQLTFGGKDYPARNYWIVAVRPDSPDRLMPADLKSGRGPHGVRRFITPLAEIQWTPSDGKVLHDCRVVFPPLSRTRGCCSRTVGPGESIQLAIDALPKDGGEICIMPGVFKENWHVANRQGIRIHGCGARTILMDDGNMKAAIITIADSQQIDIRGLTIQAPEALAIALVSTAAAEKSSLGLRNIGLEDLAITVRDQSAMQCHGGSEIRIAKNWIDALSVEGRLTKLTTVGKMPLVFVRADNVTIERNRITVPSTLRRGAAAGGVQIGGGSVNVRIEDNLISGGTGNAITLGSVQFVNQLLPSAAAPAQVSLIAVPPLWTVTFQVDDSGCILPDPTPLLPLGPIGNPLAAVSDGDLYDIRIVENELSNIGLCGISTLRYFDSGFGPIVVHGLEVRNNRITDYTNLGLGPKPFSNGREIGFGAIALDSAAKLAVFDNYIERTSDHDDPVCGVFVNSASSCVLINNRILHGGFSRPTKPGPRGGIVIQYATAPPGQLGYPAAQISNNIVIASLGRALKLVAWGAVTVEGNEFTSHAVEPGSDGAVVYIHNLAIAFETAGQFVGTAKMAKNIVRVVAPPPSSAGAMTLFDDNQVFFFPPVSSTDAITNSILIWSRGDVQMDANQSECRTGPQRVTANALVLGWSVRVTGNRFVENRVSPGLSAFTMAVLNNTSNNQGTRCFVAADPLNAPAVRSPNQSLAALSNSVACDAIVNQLRATLKPMGYGV